MARINLPPTSYRHQPLYKPELMAPAGNWTMLTAAVKSGADAVYFGTEKFNMRAKATNFSLDELPEVVKLCKKLKVKTYLTLNTILFEEEISETDKLITDAKKAGIDNIICWDLAAAELCFKNEMPFCISTQASVSNSLSASVYKRLGAKRIVLARECSLEEIKKIRANTDLEIEAFIHGAMCIAISGRCFMSHHLFGKSANRGECIQPCRREFMVYDSIIDKELVIGEDYVMSPKDLCTIEFIDKLIEAGINSFKIEGRKRSPEYVAKVVSVYRRGIDNYYEGKLSAELKKELLKELEEVYNRGFSSGFYFNTPSSEEYTNIYGSKATTRKEYAGKVINYYKKAKTAYVYLEAGRLRTDDKILIIGPTTGVIEIEISNLLKDEADNGKNQSITEEVIKGDRFTFPCPELVRPHDAVYLIVAVNQE